MNKLTRADLWSLEEYAMKRTHFRAEVMAHKKSMRLRFGGHIRLLFEDRLTVHYQIQEMLRIEKVFEPEGIQEELNAYNPLIPDGQNWKATMMLEYPDIEERKQELAKLVGIEHRIWLEIDNLKRVYAVADEDLNRSDENKTASVHFLRWELSRDMVAHLNAPDVTVMFGCDHPGINDQSNPLEPDQLAALKACLRSGPVH